MPKRPFETPARAATVSKQVSSRSFASETGEEYEPSTFDGFGDYFRRKRIKLQNSDAYLRSLHADAPQIFAGVVATIQGYTNPSAPTLHRLVVSHGGVFLNYATGKTKVTHVVATNLPPQKRNGLRSYKVVRPEWVTESVKQGKLLDWSKYRLITENQGQATLEFTAKEQSATPLLVKASQQESGSYKAPLGSAAGLASELLPAVISDSQEDGNAPVPAQERRATFRDHEEAFPSYQLPPKSPRERSAAEKYKEEEEEEEKYNKVDLVPTSAQKPSVVFREMDDDIVPPPAKRRRFSPPLHSFSSLEQDSADVRAEEPPPPPPPPPTGQIDGVELYEAERIIGERKPSSKAKSKSKRGKVKYLVKWKGYPEEEATWEFADSLKEDLGDEVLEEMVSDFRSSMQTKSQKASTKPRKSLKRKGKSTPETKVPASPNDVTSRPVPPLDDNLGKDGGLLIQESAPSQGGALSAELVEESTNGLRDPVPDSPSNVHSNQERNPPRLSTAEALEAYELALEALPSTLSTVNLTQESERDREPVLSTPLSQLAVSLPIRSTSATLPSTSVSAANASTAPPKTTSPEKSEISPKASPTAPTELETAEEFNTRLLSDPRVRETSVLNPNFLKKYYEESRLHHLSAWKTDLRADLQSLAQATSQEAPPKVRKRRYVLHVDFDCFFAAVSTRDRPELKDKPVAIAHGNSANSTSSEIASCNYMARSFGLKNGMWMAQAKKLCPELVCLPYDFPKYEEASRAFYEVILSTGAERVQAVSVDEALIDISNRCCDYGYTLSLEEHTAQNIGAKIRERIREKTGCEVSVGIASNVMLARLALRKAKPAGLYFLPPSETQSFLNGLDISAFPGIGGSIAGRVTKHLGVQLVGDVKNISKERLREVLGLKTGEKLYAFCRGIDEVPVGDASIPRRSISVDVNWGVRFENQEQAEHFVYELAKEVEKRMNKERVKTRQFTFKIAVRAPGVPYATEKFLGCGKCEITNKSVTLGVPTSSGVDLAKQAVAQLRAAKISPGELRGLGFLVSKLEEQKKGVREGQRRLDFAAAAPKAITKTSTENTTKTDTIAAKGIPAEPRINDDAEPQNKRKMTTLLDRFAKAATSKALEEAICTPAKQAVQPVVPMDTQWDIPSLSQIDPNALEFLPASLRNAIQNRQPIPPPPELELPPNAQFDIEAWNELPQDIRDGIRAEILQNETDKARPITDPQQKPKKLLPLPQSPHKNRTLPWGKPVKAPSPLPQLPPPRKTGKVRAAARGIYDKRGEDVSSWLFAEGFVDRSWFDGVDAASRADAVNEAVKMREAQIEARNKIIRAQNREIVRRETALKYINRLPRLKLARGVADEVDVKKHIVAWYNSGEEPDEEDMQTFETWLRRVVVEQRDLWLAWSTAKWFLCVAGSAVEWCDACERAVKAVNDGAAEIGLPEMEF